MAESPESLLDPASSDAPLPSSRGAAAKKRRNPKEPVAVVGLGASAGGVAVLQQFFADMPAESGLAFVVVMHLSPDYESNLATILQQKTEMPVKQVARSVKVQANRVYVIPPNHQLTFEDSTLHLVPPQQAQGRRVTIDLFFRTLAQAYGQRAVAVILSGTDSDGVIGLKHVRAQGGVTIAQDPHEAEYDSMPLTAISTGMVDWVLPVEKMAPKLMEFVRNENRMTIPPEVPEAEEPDKKDASAAGGETVAEETREPEDEKAIGEVLKHLRAQTGHDFAHYKRATVLRRIARRLQVNSLENIPAYLKFLRQHPAESQALLQDLLIGVTHFFRDRAAFAALEAHIPQLFAGKKREDQIRVWVAGCATGEEAYALAMLLCEHAERLPNPPSIQIFASDVDEHAIQDARSGLYPTTIEADVSQERLRRFFRQDHGHYRVRKDLREKVLFAAHNVLRDPPFSRIDMVSCRNLLIYLTPPAQEQVFDIFHFALRAGGLLFVGGSESSQNVESLFAPVDAKHRIYVRRSIPRPAWRIPILPGPPRHRSGLLPSRSRALPALTSAEAEDAKNAAPEALRTRQERRAILFGELHLKMLEDYGPPSVVVNEAHDIVHLSEHGGRYLQFVAGEPTADIMTIVHPALRIELRTALFRAAQDQAPFAAAPQTVEIDHTSEEVTVKVRPVKPTDCTQGFFLILFEKTEKTASDPSTERHADVTRELDREIQY
ncbi:MAG: chemotaxis protein CheB, partial [Chthoniobacterales bacterium]